MNTIAMNKTDKNPQLKTGVVLLSLFSLLLLVIFWINGISLVINIEDRLQNSSDLHLMGTDELGRDTASCLLYGTMVSVIISVMVVCFSVVLGVFMGMLSGFCGGKTDAIVMRLVDVFLAFPGILLAMALMSFLDPGLGNLVLALSFSEWVGYARLVRGEVMKIKGRDYILAARCYNASFFRIITFHFLPLLLPLITLQGTLCFSQIILAESTLNFLGLGLKPGVPTLGQMINTSREYFFEHPHLLIFPGVTLFLLVLSFAFIGEGLRKKYTK